MYVLMLNFATALPFLGQVFEVAKNSRQIVTDAVDGFNVTQNGFFAHAADDAISGGFSAIEEKVQGGRAVIQGLVGSTKEKIDTIDGVTERAMVSIEEGSTKALFALKSLLTQFEDLPSTFSTTDFTKRLHDFSFDEFSTITEYVNFLVTAKDEIVSAATSKYEYAVLATEALTIGIIDKVRDPRSVLDIAREGIEMIFARDSTIGLLYDIEILKISEAFNSVANLISKAQCEANDFMTERFAMLSDVCQGCPFEDACKEIVAALHFRTAEAFVQRDSTMALTFESLVNVWNAKGSLARPMSMLPMAVTKVPMDAMLPMAVTKVPMDAMLPMAVTKVPMDATKGD